MCLLAAAVRADQDISVTEQVLVDRAGQDVLVMSLICPAARYCTISPQAVLTAGTPRGAGKAWHSRNHHHSGDVAQEAETEIPMWHMSGLLCPLPLGATGLSLRSAGREMVKQHVLQKGSAEQLSPAHPVISLLRSLSRIFFHLSRDAFSPHPTEQQWGCRNKSYLYSLYSSALSIRWRLHYSHLFHHRDGLDAWKATSAGGSGREASSGNRSSGLPRAQHPRGMPQSPEDAPSAPLVYRECSADLYCTCFYGSDVYRGSVGLCVNSTPLLMSLC